MAQSLEGGLFSNAKIEMIAHQPGDTAANDVGIRDMKDYGEFSVLVMATALTGVGVNAFTIKANSQSNFGGTDATVATHAVGSAPDAEGDYLVLSVTAEMIKAVEVFATHGRLRYVTAILTHANNSDESAVTYIRSKPFIAKRALTADAVSA